jgi:hypothetical protein
MVQHDPKLWGLKCLDRNVVTFSIGKHEYEGIGRQFDATGSNAQGHTLALALLNDDFSSSDSYRLIIQSAPLTATLRQGAKAYAQYELQW